MEKEENIGRPVELKEPYRGYRYGNICGYDTYKYAVELSSGYVVYVFDDEFEFMD
ncbi:MAG: glyoxalase [Prevotellaceae bacterium]|nr:glyoxalase [Prevotellaceae bacterium]